MGNGGLRSQSLEPRTSSDTAISTDDGASSVPENRATFLITISPTRPTSSPTVAPGMAGNGGMPAAGATVPTDAGSSGVEALLMLLLSKKQKLKMKKMSCLANRAQAQAEEELRQAEAAKTMAAAGVEGTDVPKDVLPQALIVPGSLPVQNPLSLREAENGSPYPPSSAHKYLNSKSVCSITPTTTLRGTSETNTPSQAPSTSDHGAYGSDSAVPILEEQVRTQPSIAVPDFLNNGDLGAGERALRDLPVEHRWRFINKVVLAATMHQGLRTARLVGDLTSFAVSNERCSSETIVLGFSRVVEMLDVVAHRTPDASSHIAIMLEGAHLSNAQSVGLAEQATGYEREIVYTYQCEVV